jgi:hypothetical protein
LFPSPISPKIILVYSIIKKSWKQLLAALFMFIFIAPSAIASGANVALLPIGILGYLLFIFILEPLNFIITKLSNQYHTKSFVLLFIALIIGSITVPIIIEGSIITGLKSDLLNYIPIIGWTRATFMAMFGQFQYNVFFYLFLQIVLLVLMNYAVLRYSDDYYEDVLVSTENADQAKSRAKKGKGQFNFNFVIKKDVDIKQKGNGINAFHWKNQTIKQKSDLHYLVGIQTILFLISSIAILVIKNSQNFDIKLNHLYLMVSSVFLYIYLLFKMRGEHETDFENPYFFLIPENSIKKLIILKKLDIQRMLLNSVIFFSIPAIVDFSNVLLYFLIFLNFNSIYILLSYSDLLIKSIFRNDTDYTLMLPIIKIVQIIIVILPTIIGAIASAAIANSQVFSIITIVTFNLIAVFLILVFSGEIINRIELK